MHTLEKAVNTLLGWRPNWQQDRQDAIKQLETIVGGCQKAIAIWQDYLQSPTTPDDKVSLVKWVGSDRARQLQLINLDVIQASRAIAESAEPYYLGAAINLEPHIVEEAYRHMREGETGSDAANEAIQKMEARVKWLQDLIGKLSKASAPKKIATGKPGKKKTSKKKPVKKKSQKKAKKKAAKKATKKKTAKKKTAKKPVKKKTKKKAVKKKKTVKKKAKKTTRKKAKKKKKTRRR